MTSSLPGNRRAQSVKQWLQSTGQVPEPPHVPAGPPGWRGRRDGCDRATPASVEKTGRIEFSLK